ncbi:putative glutamine amidotransferasec [Bacteroidales bacterium Barb6XT]|nr:putative glutamine amidotransferasec [Bacteroidales bacterium Barb6XT]
MNIQARHPNKEALYGEVDRYVPDEATRPPCIGISANRKDGLSCVAETYVRAVLEAGGASVLIPAVTDVGALEAVVAGLDGLLLSGGGDINPLYLCEEPVPGLQDVDTFRDEYELILLRLAAARQIPLFGICRGHQLIHAAFGGSLWQDIYSQAGGQLIKHSQLLAREYPSHSVRLEGGATKLQGILKEDNLFVNSFHHQAVKEPAAGFITTAVSPDGINEATEHPERNILSVQWHPEAMAANGDETMQRLFRYHVETAALFRRAKALHRRILVIDSHADTPMIFPGRFDIGKTTQGAGKVNLPLMEKGLTDAVFMVAYIPQGKRDEASLKAATAYALERLTEVKRQERLNPARMGIAASVQDLIRLKHAHKKAVFLGIENAYALGKDLGNLRLFKETGVSYITLCHNGDNDVCDSASGNGEWGGLSPFGKEVVKEMNRLHIVTDVSHAAETTFYDVLETSASPVIASHSSCRALCDHPRNLTDEQIKALAAHKGVVQICLYKGFINKEEERASLSDVIRHINHAVNLVGIDHVGIGSDFDGGGEVIGCRATNELINITLRLLAEGYSDEDLRKIWGGNLLRVMSACQHVDGTD